MIITTISSLLVMGLARAQAPLTLRVPFLRTEDAIAQLAQQTGNKMSVTGEIRNYPLYLNVKSANAGEVMKRIADVVGAEWTQKGEEWVLSAGSQLKTQQDRLVDPERLELLTQTLAKEFAEASKAPEFTETLAKERDAKMREQMQKVMANMASGRNMDMGMVMSAAQAQTPAHTAIIKLLNKIGPAKLATLGEGKRAVLSTTPTEMQGAFPPNSQDILNRFMKEQRIMDQSEGGGGNVRTIRMGGPGGGGPAFGRGPEAPKGNPSSPGNAWMVVSRDGFADTINITLTVADTKGLPIASGTTILPVQRTPVKPAATKTPLVLPALAKEYADQVATTGPSDMVSRVSVLFAVGGRQVNPANPNAVSKPLSNQLRDAIANMDKVDPWSIVGAPVLDPVANTQNVIALLPDSSFDGLLKGIGAKDATCESVLAELDSEAGVLTTNEAGWLTIKPSSPTYYRLAYANRTALANLLKTTIKQGYASLEPVATFAAEQKNAIGAATFGRLHLQLIEKQSSLLGSNPLSLTEFETTRFYGTLSPQQRALLANGGSIPFRTLTGPQAEALYKMTFDSGFGPAKSSGEKNPMVAAMMSNAAPFLSGMMNMNQSWSEERTVFLRSGLPPAGVVKMAVAKQDMWMGKETSSGKTSFGGPEMVGLAKMAEKMPPMVKNMFSSSNYDRFMKASQRTLSFTFQYAPEIDMQKALTDHMVDTSKAYTYAEMPADFKKQAEEIAKSIANIDPTMFSGGGGGRINP